MFSRQSKRTLARAALFQDAPVYVQFYVTARCNLTCEQCNIIYTNADVRECTIDEVQRIADNFAAMGVAIVLLTGGEPFARKDLPEIIRAFESRGVHVRMQTNGFASEDQVARAVEAGGHDISISLDSLQPERQDVINGGFSESWHRALKTMALCSRYLPKEAASPHWAACCSRRTWVISTMSSASARPPPGSHRWCRCTSATTPTRWGSARSISPFVFSPTRFRSSTP